MPHDPQRIEVITGHERRQRYTAQEKVRLVEQRMQPGMAVSTVAGMHGISPSLLFGWRRRRAEGGQVAGPSRRRSGRGQPGARGGEPA